MRRRVTLLALLVGPLAGCATMIHGPMQDVLIDSNPPGAKATVSATLSERGPAYLDPKKTYTVTTPATLRLRRDNSYRVEMEKPGYKIGITEVKSSYDWLWSPLLCGPCEAIGEMPDAETKGRPASARFAAACYEYPKGFFKSWGRALRIFSPEALTGNAFKLKAKDAGYFEDWHAVGTPTVTANLEPTGG